MLKETKYPRDLLGFKKKTIKLVVILRWLKTFSTNIFRFHVTFTLTPMRALGNGSINPILLSVSSWSEVVCSQWAKKADWFIYTCKREMNGTAVTKKMYCAASTKRFSLNFPIFYILTWASTQQNISLMFETV